MEYCPGNSFELLLAPTICAVCQDSSVLRTRKFFTLTRVCVSSRIWTLEFRRKYSETRNTRFSIPIKDSIQVRTVFTHTCVTYNWLYPVKLAVCLQGVKLILQNPASLLRPLYYWPKQQLSYLVIFLFSEHF